MLKVFGILYAVLHAIVLAVEVIRYRRMYDHLSVKSLILNEITFVSELLLSADLYAIFMAVMFGLMYLITGETVSL